MRNVSVAVWLMMCCTSVCLAFQAAAAVVKTEELKGDRKVMTLSNGRVRLTVDSDKRKISLQDIKTDVKLIDNAWPLADGWEARSAGQKPWTILMSDGAQDGVLGAGHKIILELTASHRAVAPTYLFSYQLFDTSDVLVMGFGMKNTTGIGLKLMEAHPLSSARFLPGLVLEQPLSLNGSAGAEEASVLAGVEREAANSLLLTGLVKDKRYSAVWGGLGNEDFGKWTKMKDRTLDCYAKDPVGRLVDPGQTYWAKDTFYLDVVTADPFLSLEQYGRAMRQANKANPNVYDFPVLCGWGVGALSKLPDVNNSKALVGELEAAQKCGLTKYTKVSIRLEPDFYCNASGNTEQGWWDDAHWASFKHLVPPYTTFASWCEAISARDGIPYTYFQVGMPSDDYALANPGHMLFNDVSKLAKRHNHHQPLVSYDYTDPGFQAHMQEVWSRLRKDGMRGIKFDYPETGWRPEGGFENRTATTASAYREVFRLCREGLGPDAFLDERNLGESGRPCLDVTAGLVDTQRNWGDSNEFSPAMITIGGLRWYKNRTVFNYYPDSKTVHDCTPAIRRSMLTLVGLTSGRIDLATSFTLFTPEIVHDFTRIYPAYREPYTARPLDAFTGIKDPQVYDLELTKEWHQVALFNTQKKTATLTVPLSGDRVSSGSIGLNPEASYYVYDFWGDRFMGKLPGTGAITQKLEPSHCLMVSVRKVQPQPQLLSTDRHFLQGWVELSNVAWHQASLQLEGQADLVGGEPLKIILANNGYRAKQVSVNKGTARLAPTAATDDTTAVILESDQKASLTWTVTYERIQ
jgi:hypothetical protein